MFYSLRKAMKIIHCYQINSPILDDKLIFVKNGDFFGHFHSLLKRRDRWLKIVLLHISLLLMIILQCIKAEGRRMRNERSIIRYIKMLKESQFDRINVKIQLIIGMQ